MAAAYYSINRHSSSLAEGIGPDGDHRQVEGADQQDVNAQRLDRVEGRAQDDRADCVHAIGEGIELYDPAQPRRQRRDREESAAEEEHGQVHERLDRAEGLEARRYGILPTGKN